MKKKTEMKNYVLLNNDGTEGSKYTGHQPRQAALKAANRVGGTKNKPLIMKLRERGTKKYHVYKAWRETVPAPKNKPSWMPDMINKPFVKKVKIEKK